MVWDLLWGARWGVFSGVFFSLLALGIYLLTDGAAFDRIELTLPEVLGSYFVGGLLGGLLLGLLWSWTKTRWGAMLSGILIIMPFATMVISSLAGPFSVWGAREIFGVVGTSVLLGSMGGWELWKLWDDADRIRRRWSHPRRGRDDPPA